MLQYERQQNILDFLKEKHSATIKELANSVFFSEASVRRDIEKLENLGLVEKIYGGVVLTEFKNEVVPVDLRESANLKSKEKIAVKAAKIVNDGDTVMIDSSSTARKVCKYLVNKRNVRIITNNMRVFNELKNTDIEIFVCGGIFSKKRECFIGGFAEEFIRSVHADILFFSTSGISKTGEITDISEDEINLRKLMIKQAKKRIFLCDKTKFGIISSFKVCDKKDIDLVICDEKIEFEIEEC